MPWAVQETFSVADIAIRAAGPAYALDHGIPYVCAYILEHMQAPGVDIEYWMLQHDAAFVRSHFRPIVPSIVYRVYSKLGLPHRPLRAHLVKRYINAFKPGDIAYLWPPLSIEECRQLQNRGVFVVTEWINTAAAMHRGRLLEAYDRMGWPCPHQWSPDDPFIRAETELALASDALFAPSDFIKQSLLDVGVPESRIIRTSYGWDPERLKPSKPPRENREHLTYLFVGKDGFRKGLPLLLEMWREADISNARLVIAGAIQPAIKERCAHLLEDDRIVQLGFVKNLADLYHDADVVVHPSHEEGSPIVTCEMAACGLAMIMSPMSAGGVLRDGIDALVFDPFEKDKWVEAMRKMNSDRSYLKTMQDAARARAQDYTWDKVGAQRREGLLALYRASG